MWVGVGAGLVNITGALGKWWKNQKTYSVNGTMPTLALHFKKDKYMIAGVKSDIAAVGTFTRTGPASMSTGCATRINQNGYIEDLAPNVLRSHYSITGAKLGLKLDQASVNTIKASENINHSEWNNLSNVTIATEAGMINPRGLYSAGCIRENSVNGTHSIQIKTNAGAQLGNTGSFFVKANGRSIGRISLFNTTSQHYAFAVFDLSTGTITSTGGSGYKGSSIKEYKNGWYRVCLTGQAPSIKTEFLNLTLYNGVSNSYLGDGVSGMYIWGAQNEEDRRNPSSYIFANNTVTTTIGADTLIDTDISNWYNTEGTLVCRFIMEQLGDTKTRTVLSLDDGTTANSIGLAVKDNVNDAFSVDIVNTSANIYAGTQLGYTQGSTAIMAAGFKTNDFLMSANEGWGNLDTDGTMPTLTQMMYGYSRTAGLEGNIILQDVLFYPRRLNALELAAVTSALTFEGIDNA